MKNMDTQKIIYKNPLGEKFSDLEEVVYYYSIYKGTVDLQNIKIKEINFQSFGISGATTYICKNKGSALLALNDFYINKGIFKKN